MTNMPSAMRIKRFYSGLSLDALAALTKIDQGRLSRIERGWKRPSSIERMKIAEALGGQETDIFPACREIEK